MSDRRIVVIGAGSAGLGIGYHLQQADMDFVILEQGRVGESWRSRRWDSFALNTPNWASGLPGSPYDGDDPGGFLLRDEVVESFERHARQHALPIRTETTVVSLSNDGDGFAVEIRGPDGEVDTLHADSVVVAAGAQRVPKIPTVAERFPDSIHQIHAGDYRAPDALPEGAVLVVGSAQSGCQVSEDLLDAGRTVYLCTSRVGRARRRYRGRDTIEWMAGTGLLDQTVEDLEDPMMQYAAQPQVSGVGPRGRSVSLQSLQRRGCHLMGRLQDVSEGVVTTDDSLADNVAFADEFSAQLSQAIDAFIEDQGIDAPPPGDDPDDEPAGDEVVEAGLTELDLGAAGVSSVVWCTGFGADFSWIDLPVFDEDGRPVHDRGVSSVPGLYFLGFPWLHTRKSGILYGIDEDARWIADAIAARAGRS